MAPNVDLGGSYNNGGSPVNYGGYGGTAPSGGGYGGTAPGGGGLGSILSGVSGIANAVSPIAGAIAGNAGWNAVKGGITSGMNYLKGANTTAQGQLQPYANAGAGGIGTLNNIAQNGTTQADVSQYYNPSMAFAMSQGQQALERSAAARGGVLNGASLKDISSYITGQASTNYNNAAQLAQNSTQQQLSAGNALTQTGLAGATSGANLNVDTGSAVAGGYTQLGQATLKQYGNAAGGGAASSSGGGGGGGGVLGTIGQVAGIAGSIASIFSDERVKENIKDCSYEEVMGVLNDLDAKTFEYKNIALGKMYGVMAQQVEKTPASDLVSEDINGVKMLDGTKTLSFLLAAVTAMSKEIKALKGI